MLTRILMISLVIPIVLSLVRAYRRAKAMGGYRRQSNQWGRQQTAESNGHTRASSPYEVLSVSSGASEAEVTAAYHRLVQQYHPDKVADLAPEFREVAERRMKQINAAYEHLKRQGFQ